MIGFFFASEDERMKAKIISEFKDKVKYLNAKKKLIMVIKEMNYL